MRERGFTLVEVLVVVAVGGMIIAPILGVIHQVVFGTGRTNSQVTSLVDVNQAALIIKRDLLMNQTPLTSSPLVLTPQTPGVVVELSWEDHTSFPEAQSHTSSFALSGTKLRRTYDGVTSTVGQFITYLSLTENGRVIDVVITSTSPQIPQRVETLRFSVYRRQDPPE